MLTLKSKLNRGRNGLVSPRVAGAFLAAAAAVACAWQKAGAVTLNWDPTSTTSALGGGTGTWNGTNSNWFNGVGEVQWTDTTGTGDVAVFGGTAGTVTLNGALGALGMQFTSPGYTLAGPGTLNLGTGGIDASALATGITTISPAISLIDTGSWNVGVGSTLLVNSTLTGTGGLTKAGGGALTLGANNAGYSGAVSVTAGKLNLGDAAALGTGAVNIGNATVDSLVSGLTLSTNNAFNLSGTLMFLGTNDLNLGTGTFNLSGNRIIVTRSGTLTVGPLTSTGTNLTKQGAGTLVIDNLGNSYVNTVIQGGTLSLGKTGTIGSGTVGLNDGELKIVGTAGSARAVSAGALTFSAGRNTITLVADPGQSITFTAASVVRNAQSTQLFRGNSLGAAAGAGVANILFTTPPTVSAGTGATDTFSSVGLVGALGTVQAAVIRGALADTSATGNGITFATYDPVNGVRPLNVATEQSTITTGTQYTAATTSDNVRFSVAPSVTAAAIAFTGKQTNTLEFNNASTNNTAQTFTNSGTALNPTNGLLFTGSAPITLTGGTWTGTGQDSIVLSTNTAGVTISSVINDAGQSGTKNVVFGGSGNITVTSNIAAASNGGFFFNGPGTVTLTGTTTPSSTGYVVQGGTLKLSTGFGLSNSRPIQVAGGATLDLNGWVSPNGNTATALDSLLDFNGAGGTVTNTSAATATLLLSAGSSTTTTRTFSGVITGPINFVKQVTVNAAISVLAGQNSYTGTTTINSGNIRLGVNDALPTTTDLTLNSITAVNSIAVTVPANLDLGGFNQTVNSLSSTTLSNITLVPLINNNTSATTATLTINQGASTTFLGNIADGTGTLSAMAITKTGIGTLTLGSGTLNSYTYTGSTNVKGGSLYVNSNQPVMSANVNVTGAKLGGTANFNGNLTVGSGGIFSPGIVSGAGSSINSTTVGSLTLVSGSELDFDLSAGSNDLITSLNGLNVSTGDGIKLFQAGTANPFGNNGTFTLFTVTGTIPSQPTLQADLTILNQAAGGTYLWGVSGSNVTLQISGLAVVAKWINSSGDTWQNAANWSPSRPGAAGDSVLFGDSLVFSGQVTLDGSRTAGSITFNNQFAQYELAQGSGGSLFINGGIGAGSISDAAGSHTISAPIVLVSNTSVGVTNLNDILTISGNVSGTAGISVATGAGTVLLTGTNSYGSTAIAAGATLQVGNGSTSGTLGTGPVTFDGSLIINRSDGLTLSNTLSGLGTLTQNGIGTLVLNGANTGGWGLIMQSGGNVQLGTGGPTGSLGTGAATLFSGSLIVNTTGTATVGALSGGASISMNTTGSLLLAGNGSNYNGQITITGTPTTPANLILGADSATGSTAATLILDNVHLTENNVSTTMVSALQVADNITIDTFGSKNMTLSSIITGTASILRSGGTGNLTFNTASNAGFNGSFTNTIGTVTFVNKASGSALAAYTFMGTGTVTLTSLGGTISFGSLSGNSPITTSGNTARLRAGDLGTNTTYTGTMIDAGGGLAFLKAGTGTMTLTGQNKFSTTDAFTFTGTSKGLNAAVGAGTLVAGASTNGTTSGPFGASTAGFLLGNQANLADASVMIGGPFTIANNIMVSGGGPTSGTASLTMGGNTDSAATYTGNITLQSYVNVSQVANTGTNALTVTGGFSGTASGIGPDSPNNGGFANTGTQFVTFTGAGQIVATGPITDGTGLVGVAKTGLGTTQLSGLNTYTQGTTVNSGALVFASTASLPATGNNATPTGNLIINSGTVGAGTFGGKVVIGGDAGNLANYVASLTTAYDNGAWDGIASVMTQTGTATRGLGYMDGGTYITLNKNGAGYAALYTINPTDMLIRYTYMGDADLSGTITLGDYALIDAGFFFGYDGTHPYDGGAHPARWFNGDFNYDGVVNYKDYAIIDASFAAFGTNGPLAQSEIANHTAEFGQPYVLALESALSAVPEPASLGLLALGAVSLLGRKRR